MKNIIKNIANNEITNLMMNQGSVFLVPFILTPYLLRVMDIETYGKLVFGQAVVGVLIIIVEWGYNWSIITAKNYEGRRKNIHAINVFFSQLILFIILAVAWLVYFSYFDQEGKFIVESLFLLGANVAMPYWYYFLYDNSNLYARISALSRISSCILIITFVRTSNDINLYFILQSLPIIAAGLVGCSWLPKSMGLLQPVVFALGVMFSRLFVRRWLGNFAPNAHIVGLPR